MTASEANERMREFVAYVRRLDGDEKGEAHVFCDRLFQAFGHAGYKEAGAKLEYRVRKVGKKKTTKFADLVWAPRVLIEMKSRDEDLSRHYKQAFDYWVHLVPHRPRFVVLCNFDQFWVYDFDQQLDEPMDRLTLDELPARYSALNFLFPVEKPPHFNNNRIAVTRAAADKLAQVFRSLVRRRENRQRAQRFVLQTVVALFSEDIELLPRDLVTEVIDDCRKGQSTYDLLGDLFRQMNSEKPARGGRFAKVPYFNGGIFATIDPVELNGEELEYLAQAATENWSLVNPAVFGTLFESSMDEKERHAYGAHFTSEADIYKVVHPTIVVPWREQIEDAKTGKELLALRQRMLHFRVLDPACGSGNFIYLAYRELKRLEADLLNRITEYDPKVWKQRGVETSLISASQFHGIDTDPFAVELAKVTLMLGKKLALDETEEMLREGGRHFPFDYAERALPLDNLDKNIVRGDALLLDWPEVDCIIGNPPYQSKNKIQQEMGPAYLRTIRARYPKVPGRADYCVYWFRKAHDRLPKGGRAGLVGTNTIRQNYSREGGLDHIVSTGGTITNAVSTQVWSGEAVVHVSIVNWVKGDQKGKKRLSTQLGDTADSPWESVLLDHIPAALSAKVDVTSAVELTANARSGATYQGITPGHDGFVLTQGEAAEILLADEKNEQVVHRYLIADDLLEGDSRPSRLVIDFGDLDIIEAEAFAAPFGRVRRLVLPAREAAFQKEERRNAEVLREDPKAKVNHHHANFLKRWWLMSYSRNELKDRIRRLSRYIVCSRITRRPIFEFVHPTARPGDSLQAFTLEDDYSFGILQSGVHWEWFVQKGSSMKGDPRYTSNTVFDTFPWPQRATKAHVAAVAEAAIALRALRRQLMKERRIGLRDLYRTLDLPGENPLRTAQDALDEAVRAAYGMGTKETLSYLLALNHALAEREKGGEDIVGPGIPPSVRVAAPLVTADCVK